MVQHVGWDDLRALYERIALAAVEREVPRGQPHHACNVEFARGRFTEGYELAAHFAAKYGDRELSILDVGSGNGGVSIALANESRNRVVATDVVYNTTLARLRAESRLPLVQVIASADHLPFAGESFDVILCLETVEHLPGFRAAAREMMRVLRRGGEVMITTPARLRYLFAPDPHFAVRGLLLLPDALQRRVVVQRLRLTSHYDVEHIFWSAGTIIRAFPGRRGCDTMVAIPPPGIPRNLRERLWRVFRRLLWDRIAIYK